MISKPKMKSRWRGTKGSKYRTYEVTYKGKTHSHLQKRTALHQYEAGMRLYKKKKKKMRDR